MTIEEILSSLSHSDSLTHITLDGYKYNCKPASLGQLLAQSPPSGAQLKLIDRSKSTVPPKGNDTLFYYYLYVPLPWGTHLKYILLFFYIYTEGVPILWAGLIRSGPGE